LELTALYSSIKREYYDFFAAGGFYAHSYKLKNKYAASLQLGRICGNFLPYIKVGYARSNFRALYFVNRYVESSKAIHGLDVGLGVSAHIRQNLLFNAEFTFTPYKKIKVKYEPFFRLDKLEPRLNTFMLGVKYIFNAGR
jgi:opacity protein-like surface antigen